MSEKKKILIIEDDKFYRLAYKDGLEDEGYIAVVASDGKEGIDKIKKEKPDLILLDLIMPVEGGFDVLTKLNKDKNMKNTPVIILSNLGQDSDIEKAKELGAIDYLIKSDVTMKEVLSKVEKYIK